MTYCGIEYSLKNRPALDGDFLPFAPWRQAYLAQAAHPIRIAIERQDGQTAVFDTRLRTGKPTCGFWSAPSSCCCGA